MKSFSVSIEDLSKMKRSKEDLDRAAEIDKQIRETRKERDDLKKKADDLYRESLRRFNPRYEEEYLTTMKQVKALNNEVMNLRKSKSSINEKKRIYEEKSAEKNNALRNLDAAQKKISSEMMQAMSSGDVRTYKQLDTRYMEIEEEIKKWNEKELPSSDYTPEIEKKAKEINEEIKREAAAEILKHLDAIAKVTDDIEHYDNQIAEILQKNDLSDEEYRRPAHEFRENTTFISKIKSEYLSKYGAYYMLQNLLSVKGENR